MNNFTNDTRRWQVQTYSCMPCIVACALLLACSTHAANEDTFDSNVDFVNVVRSDQELAALSASDQTPGVKYLAKIAGAADLQPLTEPCYFQNMHRYPWHLQFLQSFMELSDATLRSYRDWVMRRATRQLWGGSLQSWPQVTYPNTDRRGVIAYELYSEPGGLDVDDIARVDALLKQCMPFAREQLVFMPDAPDQASLVTQQRNALRERGVLTLFPDELLGTKSIVAYTEGEGYGFLRVIPEGQALDDSVTYGPHDILVLQSAPNDISIVAGLLTSHPQNELGHVNLRLREKGTPNAAVPAIYADEQLTALDAQLVHLTVSADAIAVVKAEPAAAQAFWDAKRPTVPKPDVDLTARALSPLTDLHASAAHAFGTKCANLGELTHVLDAPHRPDGFGVPFARYDDFAKSPPVAKALTEFLEAPELATDAAFKRAGLAKLRKSIRKAALPDALFNALHEAITARFGSAGTTTYLRFRSSTNVEDLGEASGAGLYDSHSGCLADDLDADEAGPSACLTTDKRTALEQQLVQRQSELTDHPERAYLVDIIDDIQDDLSHEKPVSDAVRKVYASLWNERAFDEREYYGIDQRSAYMGLAVIPAYQLERVNAVAVSNLRVDDGPPLYRINSQVGELSVVTPEDPTASAELLTFRRQNDPPEATHIQLELGSSLVAAGAEVWPRDKLLELSQLLFTVHDHFAQHVYAALSPLALDFEVKLERSGDVIIKQVRPYVSRDPDKDNRP